jgi:hypothetical protein
MTKREALIDLLHHADVTLSYWDRKRSGAAERELTAAERMLLISALRRTSAVNSNGDAP